jgi:hypothetical protein
VTAAAYSSVLVSRASSFAPSVAAREAGRDDTLDIGEDNGSVVGTAGMRTKGSDALKYSEGDKSKDVFEVIIGGSVGSGDKDGIGCRSSGTCPDVKSTERGEESASEIEDNVHGADNGLVPRPIPASTVSAGRLIAVKVLTADASSTLSSVETSEDGWYEFVFLCSPCPQVMSDSEGDGDDAGDS